MGKIIIYLHQNFVSDTAKAKSLKKSFPLATEYLWLYDRLEALVRNDRVICPESLIHQIESIEAPKLAPAIQESIARRSYGLKFYDWHTSITSQAYRAMKVFLGHAAEGSPTEWSHAFGRDPHGPRERLKAFIGPGEVICFSSWPVGGGGVSPKRYLDYRNNLRGKLSAGDRGEYATKVADDLILYLYGPDDNAPARLRALGIPDEIDVTDIFGAIQDVGLITPCLDASGRLKYLAEAWLALGAPLERFPAFLQSRQLRECPFIEIFCTLRTELACETSRNPKASDMADIVGIAAALPYCSVMGVDMADLLKPTKLDRKYQVTVFSTKRKGLKDLRDWLNAFVN